jgi:glyoxylase-like metal-dependent hydrolase (beta-lactamase superfamily II)
MSRALKIIGIVLVVVIAGVGGAVASAFLGRRALVDGAETQGVRIVKDGIVGVAMVAIAADQVALIDAGTDGSGKAILAELSRRQLGPDAVTAIFITHGHQDHTAAIKLFPRATVMALAAEVPLIEGHAGAHGPLTQLFPVKPTGVTVTRPLHDGETVSLGTVHVQVFAVPGHTAGSAAYLVNGVLCLGDAADAGSDGKAIGAPWIFSDSQAQDRASVAALVQRLQSEHAEVRATFFAHSGLLKEGLQPFQGFAR